jgi:hypothetical protein
MHLYAKIAMKYTGKMQETCKKHAENMQKTCRKHAENMT